MRPLKSHFPADAFTTLTTLLQQTKEARVFRRAQAVREVVAGHHVNTVSVTLHFTNSALRTWVQRLAHQGVSGRVDRPRSGRPRTVTCALDPHRNRLVDQDPLQHGSRSSQWSGRELATVWAPHTGGQLGRERVRGVLKNIREVTAVPLGGSTPTQPTSPLAPSHWRPWNSRRGAIIVLYADETIVWRLALLQRGWARRTRRSRLPTRPLSPKHIQREEALKRQVWTQQRAWSRISSGGWLHVIGAVPYGTSKVFYTIVPHFAAQDIRQYIHPVMASCRPTKKAVVMVVDRSGLHRAHKLDTTLDHYHGRFRFPFFPARCGHHLHPIEGFWRALKDAIGAGRCVSDLQRLYKRTRHVLMAHQAPPISAFRW